MKKLPPTRTPDQTEPAGWLFYDADCAWCRGLVRRWGAVLRRTGYEALPLQTPGTAERLGVTEAALLARMHLLTADGRCYAGADAYVEMARARVWSRPFAWMAAIPGVTPLLRRSYDWIAARRHCVAGACRVELPRRASSSDQTRVAALDALPLLILPAAVLFARFKVAPWVLMWLLAVAVYAGCKWLTLRSAVRGGLRLSRWEKLGYLVAWVGMEPREFQRSGVPRARSGWGSVVPPLVRIGVGFIFLYGGTPRWADTAPLLAGWLGMTGVILILHFGLFDLLALGWRRLGYPVKTLMNAPSRAAAVGNFWSARWNRAFHALVQRFVHRPLLTRLGAVPALFGVFLVSGAVHDLVISFPAGGGYGQPTLYFLIQGLALWLERSAAGRLFGLGSGGLGRAFALVIVVGPLALLFPPVFIRHVILPMLDAIGAT